MCLCLSAARDTVPCPAGSLCSLTFFSTLRLWHGRGTGADESLRGDRDEQSVCACVQPVKSWIYYKLSNVTASPAPPQTRRPLWLAACPVHTQPVQSWIQGEKRRRRTGDCSETCVLRSQRRKIQPLQRPVSTQVNHLSKVKACFMDTHSQKRQNILLLTAVSALTGLWLLLCQDNEAVLKERHHGVLGQMSLCFSRFDISCYFHFFFFSLNDSC